MPPARAARGDNPTGEGEEHRRDTWPDQRSGLTMAQPKQEGAVIEVCFLSSLPQALDAARSMFQAAKELGAKSLLISCDLGERPHRHNVAQEPGQADRS